LFHPDQFIGVREKGVKDSKDTMRVRSDRIAPLMTDDEMLVKVLESL